MAQSLVKVYQRSGGNKVFTSARVLRTIDEFLSDSITPHPSTSILQIWPI